MFGQTAALAHHEFTVEEGWEYLHEYKPGGYCPIHLGDRLDGGTYTIVHKLGYGATSTVWMARNTRYGSDPEKYPYRFVALKILRADKSSNSQEASILKHLGASSTAQASIETTKTIHGQESAPHPASSTSCHPGIIRLIHTFTHHSANGLHEVMVLPVVRPLNDLSYLSCHIGTVLKDVYHDYISIARQLFEAATFLHEKGVVHGDITETNVGYLCEDITELEVNGLVQPEIRSTWLWRYPDEASTALSAFSQNYLRYCDPSFHEDISKDISDYIPRYMARTWEWEYDFSDFERWQNNPRIVLMDFSHSFMKNTPQKDRPFVGTMHRYRAPEYRLPTHCLQRCGDVDAPMTDTNRWHGDYRDALGDFCEKIDVWACAGTIKDFIGAGAPWYIGRLISEQALLIDPCVPDDWKRMKVVREAIENLEKSTDLGSEKAWEKELTHVSKGLLKAIERRKAQQIDSPQVDLIVFPLLFKIIRFAMRLDPRTRPSAVEVSQFLRDTMAHGELVHE